MTAPPPSYVTSVLGGQLWRYGVTGLVNTGVGLFLIVALHKGFGVGLLASNAVGYGVGLICSFTLNRSWTFASRGNTVTAGVKYVVLIAAAFGLCFLVITTLQAADAPYLMAQILGTALYSLVVFLGAKYVIFSP